jgi:cyclophilin family peptidyl-prolyl cis-trans isomerase
MAIPTSLKPQAYSSPLFSIFAISIYSSLFRIWWPSARTFGFRIYRSVDQCPVRLPFFRTAALLTFVQFFAVGCAHRNASQPASPLLLTPDAPAMNLRAPAAFHVRLETSKGPMLLEIHRDWSPHGADRFYNLVRAGFYDDARFFRVIAGRWAQFGINGAPNVARLWRTQTISDDPRQESNVRGTIAYAFAVPNGRTTQVFINLRDNSATHDPAPFVPFGRVVEGMDVADALDAEYGESAGGGIRGGKQGPLFEEGNDYLKLNFPRLDYIKRAMVVEPGASTIGQAQ